MLVNRQALIHSAGDARAQSLPKVPHIQVQPLGRSPPAGRLQRFCRLVGGAPLLLGWLLRGTCLLQLLYHLRQARGKVQATKGAGRRERGGVQLAVAAAAKRIGLAGSAGPGTIGTVTGIRQRVRRTPIGLRLRAWAAR